MTPFALLLVYDRETNGPLSADNEQALMGEVREWYLRMREDHSIFPIGALRDGELRRIRKVGKRLKIDGPFTETKEILVGIFVLEAPTHEDAVELASGCPIIGDRGFVDVQPLIRGSVTPPLDDLDT